VKISKRLIIKYGRSICLILIPFQNTCRTQDQTTCLGERLGLIVKHMGRCIDFKALENMLKELWVRKSVISITIFDQRLKLRVCKKRISHIICYPNSALILSQVKF